MTIPALPPAPALGDSPEVFNTKAFEFVAALDDWGTEANATGVAVNANAVSADADAATATTQAGIATTGANTATTQAGIATTKAGEAATSANSASSSATAANLSAVAAAASAASIDPATLVKLTGDQTIAGVKTFTSKVIAEGLTVGKGAGSVATNTAVGASALAANSTGSGVTAIGADALAVSTASNNTAVGYQAAYANTAADNTAIGVKAMLTNTTGTLNVATGGSALRLNTTGSSNTAMGVSALFSNTTASNNTAVGYQAGYGNTTGIGNTYLGDRVGHDNAVGNYNTYVGGYCAYATSGSSNTFIGNESGYLVTTGSKNTILGRYNGNQDGLNISTANNYVVLSDGDGNIRQYVTGSGNMVLKTTRSSGGNAVEILHNQQVGVAPVLYWSGDFFAYGCDSGSFNAAAAGLKIQRIGATGRSINTAGTINASGADYAEYMIKSSLSFSVAKGDVVGINADGKLTNVFADAVSFVVKSTDPSYVGGDTWGAKSQDKDAPHYTEEELEEQRAWVDRIAFSGQVPVNVLGATAGQYIVPVNDNGSIKGIAVNESDMTLAQYMSAVGRVIAIEQDGRAKIIVKVA